MSAVIGGNSNERILSPKRKNNFKGELVILDQGAEDAHIAEKRLESAQSNGTLSQPFGGLEVLESGRPSSGRVEKRLPLVKRKEEKECLCDANHFSCKCLVIHSQLKELSIHGENRGRSVKMRECMAPRAPAQSPSFAETPRASGENTVNDPKESESSSSDDEDGEDDEDGNSYSQLPRESRNAILDKAPLELLGKFLTALMNKDFSVAKDLCNEILEIEPDNRTCLEFQSTLQEKIEQDEDLDRNETKDEEDSEEDDDEDDDEDTDSEACSSADDSGHEGASADESDTDDLGDIDVNKLNLFMGGVPVKKKNLSQ